MTTQKLDWRTVLSIKLGSAFLRALAATWRFKVVGWPLGENEKRDPIILCLWHGQMLPLLCAHRGNPTTVLVSEHRDGEIISRILASFGFSAARGSSSRGGARALLELAAIVKSGKDIAVTPDGPRGPRHSMAPGTLLVSHRTGAAIVPLVCFTESKWQLKTWDGFEIPRPFARITVLYDLPQKVLGDSAREVAESVPLWKDRMSQAMEKCVRLHQN